MKIHFIVGTFGSGRQKIFKKLLSVLKKTPNVTAIGDGIGGTAGADNLGGFDTISLEMCLYQIKQAITMFSGKDHYVFTGTGLTKHIREIMKVYPEASLYMLRRYDPALELNPDNIASITSKFEVTESWLNSFNTEVRSDLEAYADELGITWRSVNSPVFVVNDTPNWADDPASSNSNIEVAAYNV